MSKSLGNIFQLSEAVERFGAAAIVAYLSSGHYRQPLDFSEQALRESQARLARIVNYLREPAVDGPADDFVSERREIFLASLADDFNTPRAWAAVFEIVAEGNRRPLAGAHDALAELLELLGLESLLAAEADADSEAEALNAERDQARAAGDYARSDELRDRLAALGWEVRDTPAGGQLRSRD